MQKIKVWIVCFFRIATDSFVWLTPWSLLVLAITPPSYQCWLAEKNLGTLVANWVSEHPCCINFSPPSFDVTIPLWGIILVPIAALTTGCIKKTDAWNPILRLALSAVGLWLYLAIPLYFLWLAGRS
ncbi:MAG: hypothetical protein PHF42_09570 [Pseudomonas sp.]|nr:hypothetical protein [Pseudomonas sp.]